jgi:hypothetical protein
LPAQLGAHTQTLLLPQAAPLLHRLPLQQACPTAPQATHEPPLHTVPAPHPGGQVPPHPSGPQVAAPQLGAQMQVPPEQVPPALHMFPAQQACPTAPQVTQLDPWHMVPAAHPGGQVPPHPSGPQLLPAHDGAQAQVPFTQLDPGSQLVPPQQAWPMAPQEAQVPLAPQAIPAAQPGGQLPPQPSGPQVFPAHDGVQTHIPPLQVAPPLHEPAQQGCPATPQPVQFPLGSQASRLPQLVPAGAFPVTVQTGVPDEQLICAVRHTGPAQPAPATQSTQVPVDEQTRLVPQEVPGASIPVSVQTGSPVSQEIWAVWQAGAGQLIPGAHAWHTPVDEQT